MRPVLVSICALAATTIPSLADKSITDRIEPSVSSVTGETTITQPERAWSVQKETSKIDDSVNVFASMVAEEPFFERYGEPKFLQTIVRCREGHTDFLFNFGDMFMSDIQGYGQITIRLDKQKAKKIYTHVSTDNKVLGLWNGQGIKLLKELIGKKQMLVVGTPYNESNAESVISLNGFETALTEVRKACKW